MVGIFSQRISACPGTLRDQLQDFVLSPLNQFEVRDFFIFSIMNARFFNEMFRLIDSLPRSSKYKITA